jgi:hypothetical protein
LRRADHPPGEEVFWYDDKVGHRQTANIVVQQKEIGIGIAVEAAEHRTIGTVIDLVAEQRPLALQLIVFLAGRAIEVTNPAIVGVPD